MTDSPVFSDAIRPPANPDSETADELGPTRATGRFWPGDEPQDDDLDETGGR